MNKKTFWGYISPRRNHLLKKMLLSSAVATLIVAGFFVVSRNVLAADTIVATDTTPRIMYWGGKVDQHIDTITGQWLTDPDGTSGADIDPLTYCQKWYPNTVSVEPYMNETITTWQDTGNVNDYTSTKMSTECVQNVVPATLLSIAITTPATKLSYTVGDTLNIDGLIVTGTYSDGTTKVETITTSDITDFDSSAPAVNQVLTITVEGDTTTYTINIVAVPNTTPLAPINLLSSGNFTILSETGITDTGSHTSVINGNIGSSPITAASMSDVFCPEVTGEIYGVDMAYTGNGTTTCFAGNPPLANKTLVDNAVLDMGTAYNEAAGRTNPTATELGAGNIGGMTLAPGLYKWSSDVTIPTDVNLSGGPNDVWIFQIAGNLNIASAGSVSSGVKVILTGGAKASNVFWQVGGVTGATLGTYSTFNGTILTAKQIIIQTGAVLNGKALAQTEVTLDSSTITNSTDIVPVPDVTAPIITLIGSSSITLSFGNTFTDPGATAFDNIDGNITGSIVTVNPVNSNLAGTYTITYNVADKAGNQAKEITRTVVVNQQTNGGGSSSGGGQYILPSVTTSSPSAGQVLGASTEKITCGIYLDSYVKYGSENNNQSDVKKLQGFLNGELGLNIPVDGIYNTETFNAVKVFQVKYTEDILTPWASYGMSTNDTREGTGYVYKTTERWINEIECPGLNIPMPDLSNN